MKQKLLLKTMLLLCALVAGVSSAWADDPVLEFNLNELYQNETKVTAKTVISTSNGTLTFTDEHKNFTILLTRKSGNQPGFYTSSGYFRFYNGDTFKLSAAHGITISKVVITSNGSNFSLSALDGLDTSKKTWTGSASEVTFTGTGTNKWDKLTITYTTNGGGTPSCVAPTFDPEAGTYNKVQNVVISTTTDDATIYYTLDGTDPTTSSIVYTSAISLSESKTIKAIAVKDGYNNSSVATAAYTIYLPYTVTLADNSATLTEEERGAGVTLPARDALNGYDFVGWSETNVSAETTTAPTIIPAGAYTPSADITLYPVYSKTIGGGGVSHESTSVTISDYATANNWSSGTRYTSIILDENVTASGKDNGNNSKYYSSSPGTWRHYAGDSGEITITTTSGELTSVTLTYTGNTIKYGNNDVISGTAITVSGTSAVFTVSGSSSNSQISAISVNYDISGAGTTYYWSTPVAAAVEMPNIVIAENPFLFSTTATITCTTDGATIKYSYDGENWNDYSSALTITETKTIYAKAVKGNDESSVAQYTATKNLAEPTVTVTGDLTLDLDGKTNVEAGTLTAAVTYNEAAVDGAVVTWTSSNTDVATIDAETGAVTIKTTGTVTFTATYAGNSDYAEATGTKTVTVIDSKIPGSEGNPYTVAQALEVINALADNGTIADRYVTGKISQIDSYYSSYKSITYWISDDGTTTSQMQVYSGKGLNGADFSAVTDLNVGDVVTVFGELKKYVKNSTTTPEFNSGSQIKARTELPASDLTKISDITLDYKNGATDADLTSYFTTSSAGAITYTVADETVIERAEELISALKVGTTTVTVSQAATLSYKAGEIVINVTVQDTREAATTIPAINVSTLKVGNSGTVSVTNPVKADEGVTFSYASSDDGVLLIVDDAYEAVAVGTATVTVTATPSNTNLYKPVVANFPVTVELATKTDTEIALDEEEGSTIYGTQKSVDFVISDGYDGELTYTIDNAAIADVQIGASAITFTPKAVGTAVITFSAPETATFNAAEDIQYTLTVTAPVGDATAPATVAPVTLDFSDNTTWSFPTSKTVTANTYTSGDYSVVLTGTTGNGYYFFDQNDCLLIGKSGATIQLPSFDNVIEQIDVTGHSGASGSVKLNIFEGETAVSTEVTGIQSTQNFAIKEANQGANKTYTLKITSAANAQIKNITFNFKNVTITSTLNASGYATFCSQYPLDFSAAEGYTAWQIKSINGEEITFEKITGAIKGGQGILLKGEAGATVTLASADSDAELSENLLFGTTAPTYIATDEYYGLSGNTFKKVGAGNVPAGKALLPASAITAGARELQFVFEDETTAIRGIENGQLRMENSFFDLQGRKIAKPTKGLYIKNGKKVVLK